jgi:hypothetical protein
MISGNRRLAGPHGNPWRKGGLAAVASICVLWVACDEASELDPLTHGPIPEICEPQATRSCYDGPAGTEGIGSCQAGTQTCADHGRAWGPCSGQVGPEPEDCETEDDENCDAILTCGQVVSSLRVGVDRDEVAWDVGVDGDDNTFLTGYYRDPVDFGGGALVTTTGRRDIFVTKLSPEGDYRWSHGLYGDNHFTPRGLAVDPDGSVAVLASFSGSLTIGTVTHDSHGGTDGLVAKFGPDGDLLWSARYGETDHQNPVAATIDGAGNLYLTGYFAGEIDFGGGPLSATTGSNDLFVAKLDPDGAHLWSKSFVGLEDQIGQAVAVDSAGAIYLVGYFAGEVDFGQGMHAASGDEQDVFVVKLDGDGETLWSRTYGDESQQQALALAIDGQDDLLVVGRLEGSIDFGAGKLEASGGGAAFVAKLDGDGQLRWSQALVGPANLGATAVAIDSRDRVLVTGFYEGSVTLGHTVLPESGVYEPSIFVTKLEPDGRFVWSRGIKVHGDQAAGGVSRAWRSLAIRSDDQAVLAGYVRGDVDFGDGEVTGAAGADIFAAWLEP